MPDGEDKILGDAVARNCGAILSLPSAGMLRHCKSRFLGENSDGLLMEAPAQEAPLVQSLIQSRHECVVAFTSGIYKVAFSTHLLQLIPQYPVSSDTFVDALLLAQPTEVKALQRRAHYRARVFPDCDIRARIWCIDKGTALTEVPTHAQEVICELRDLSVGGLGARFVGKQGKPPKITVADRLRIQIMAGKQTLVVEGRMRDPRGDTGADAFIAGICFQKLENNHDGRRILAQLTRMVGDLQREELRQHRLGLNAA